eukprot:14381697-Alexandrium_andersonii.AAC.1
MRRARKWPLYGNAKDPGAVVLACAWTSCSESLHSTVMRPSPPVVCRVGHGAHALPSHCVTTHVEAETVCQAIPLVLATLL